MCVCVCVFIRLQSGDNNASSKANSSNTENANTSADDSNASSAGNTTTNSSEGAVKFVEAPLPKVNAWKVSVFFLSFYKFLFVFSLQNFTNVIVQLSKDFRQYFMQPFPCALNFQLGRTFSCAPHTVLTSLCLAVEFLKYLMKAIAV